MAAISTSDLSVQGKRKRAVVNYAEPDEDDFALDPEDDPEYGKPAPKEQKRSKKVASIGTTTATPPEPEPEAPFPFLDLPAEIRNQIYEYALSDAYGIGLVTRTRNHGQVVRVSTRTPPAGYWYVGQTFPHRNNLVPNLTVLNKQLRTETINYLYQQHFHLPDSRALLAFLSTIGHANAARLREITVYNWRSDARDYAAMTALAPATALRRSTIKDFILRRGDTEQYARNVANKIWRQSHFFIQAYGAAAGRRDAALGIINVRASFAFRMRHRNVQQDVLDGMQEAFLEQLRRFVDA